MQQGKGVIYMKTFKDRWIDEQIDKSDNKFNYMADLCCFDDRETYCQILTRNPLNEGEKQFTVLAHVCFDCASRIVSEFQKQGYQVKLKRVATREQVLFTWMDRLNSILS